MEVVLNIKSSIEEYLGAKQNSITHDTYAWYALFLDAFSEWCTEQGLTELRQITAQHVQQFVSACPTPNTNTRHARAQIVKGFLSWCAQDEETGVKEKTVRRIEMPRTEQKEIHLFTDAEIRKLFRACDRTRNSHRNKAILHILLDTGIRAAELAYDGDRPDEDTGLRMENLILGRDDSFIRVMGKGRKPRTIGLGQETSQAMRRYLNRERGRSDSPYVFLGRGDEPLSVRALQDLLTSLG
jgi:site-specific recombinase XerD